jgi:acyl CoA:acetate/3-ketoacid CoA transferase
MANIGAFAQKQILDWVCGGAVVNTLSPALRFVGLDKGTPFATTATEMGIVSGYARQTVSFGAANSPAGSVSNNTALTFGPFSSIATIQGLHMWDQSAAGSTNMWLFGTLQTARTVGVGDSLVVAAGALTITLS